MESQTMSPLKRKKTEKETEFDLFRMLPDDIIGSILSRLTMAEAVRSSVLCVRWRYLWTYYIASLDFDASYVLHQLKQRRRSNGEDLRELIYEERDRFRRWVYQVLNSLRTQTVESLGILFDLGNDSNVDNWVQFAIHKKVKKLHLNLVNTNLANNDYDEHCVVPSLLKLSTLQVLRLSWVDVSGEDLEYLLSSSCPFLETLAVNSSERLRSFKVCSHSKLKQLEIIRCSHLKTLEISAQNLVSFTYVTGSGVPSIHYKHIPNLKEVCFGGLNGDVLFSNFFRLTTYGHSSYLKVLKLTMTSPCWSARKFQLPKNLVLAALHHLELFFMLMEDDGYNVCISLMNQCPFLRALTLKIVYHKWTAKFGIKQKQTHACDCVEEVKVIGFSGSSAEVKFIEYIIKNAPNLKKMIINPISPIYQGNITFEYKSREADYSSARTRAKNMELKIPPYVEFVIL